ncbi:MAG: ParA family protein [Peptococcaceae bacterium]|nr:ParA family protein [Peptococcaceae bacterium]
MAKVISLINQKGGAGKTTSTNAITVCLKHKGYRVLCVDFDPQGYLSFSMNADTRDHPTIYDVLKHKVKCRYAIQHNAVAPIIPADALLGNVEREFTGTGSERMLKDCLKTVSPLYDYILIDSPPELGLLSSNAVVASNVVLIPGLSDGYSLQGMVQVHETICRIKQAFNPDLVIGGMFLVRYYPREDLSRTTWETAKLLTEHLGIPLLETRIRHSNVISKAMTTLQRDIVDYAPRNNAVLDYMALVDELFERGIF